MNVTPTKLELVDQEQLRIEWSDGQRRIYSFRELRRRCPCASCREQSAQDAKRPPSILPILTEAETLPLKVVRMRPVGNYAYSIEFSDGHDTGIYTFELLRELGRAEQAEKGAG
jgi:DUF971 family protein